MVVAGVVLAGGGGRRMGGLDKAALHVGGVALLDRVLAAARPVCERLVVVGPTRPTEVRGVEFVTEEPPGGGPVPAILAGARAVGPGCDVVLVIAADLPLLTTGHLRRLLAAVDKPDADAAAAADVDGPNPLLAAYRGPALAARATRLELAAGEAAGRLLPDSLLLVDLGPAILNVNRPDDLAAAEILVVHDEEIVVTTQWLRGVVKTALPDAVESIYAGWHGFGYRHATAGYMCAVFPRGDDVRLSFEHGIRLADPRGLLEGQGRQVRHVVARQPDDPPASFLVELIDAAVELG